MQVRITVEIDGKKHGVLIENAEKVPSREFGRIVEATIDHARGYDEPARYPISED